MSPAPAPRTLPMLLAAVLIAACTAPSPAGFEPPALAKIDALVRAEMAQRRIPGCSIAIVDAADVTHLAAYGLASIQHGAPAREDTVYELASLTKAFVAAGVPLLRDEGKLQLDDEIDAYVPESPACWRGVTLRHLLTHTAGLPAEDETFASMNDQWRRYMSRAVMLDALRKDPISWPPGGGFRYSSGGYFLAALAIERASGLTFREFLKARLLRPLGMTRTLVHDELRIVLHEAQGYSLKDGELVNIWRDCMEEVPAGIGLFSTAGDLARWELALRHHTLLSAATTQELFRPARLADGTALNYGLGWWLAARNGIAYHYHNGITGTEMLRIPGHDLSVIVLTNLGRSAAVGSDEATPWGIAHAIAAALVPGFAITLRDEPMPPQRLAALAGEWQFGYGQARFFVRDDSLWIADRHGTSRLHHQGGDVFRIDTSTERLVFERDDAGNVRAARWEDETWSSDPGQPKQP